MKHLFYFLAFIILPATSFAQVGIGTSTPTASAQLDVTSSNKGFLPPRIALTSVTDVSTISSPASGLLVYNTSSAGSSPNNVTPGYYYYDGTKWQRIVQNGGIIFKKTILINSVAPSTTVTGASTVSDWSGTYTASGGNVEVRANFTAWTSSSTGSRTFKLLRDGTEIDNCSFYFNSVSVHTLMPELIALIPNESGNHTYAIQIGASTIVDSGDQATIVVSEYKFP